MPKYLIEREIPGAGKLSPEQLRGISQKSCSVLNNLGPQIQWIQSYVTGDKIYCVYRAPNEEMVRVYSSPLRHRSIPRLQRNRIRSSWVPTENTKPVPTQP